MIRLLFQGDSITDCNRDRNTYHSLGVGYAAKVAQLVKEQSYDNKFEFVNRGISGNTTADLLQRYDTDFTDINPNIISILIGINDTWRRYEKGEPTSTEQFYFNYDKLLAQIKRDLPYAKIILLEPFLLNTMPDRIQWREDLDPKIGVVRQLARKYADAYIALDGIIQQYVVFGISDTDFAVDAVHPSDIGHAIIAKEYFKVLKTLL